MQTLELALRWPLSTVRRGMAPKEAVVTRRRWGQDASDVTVVVVTTRVQLPHN